MKYCVFCMKETNSNICSHCGRRQDEYIAQPHVLAPGTFLKGKYQIGSVIGNGGFGITYIGLDTVLLIRVAIKEFFPVGMVTRSTAYSNAITAISTELFAENMKNSKNGFLSEARTLAKFDNEPGIVTVKDWFEENNTAYIVTEFLDGETLKQYLDRVEKLSLEGIKTLLIPVMKSLKVVHEAGLIHRDISPDNIMIADGTIKLIDFGAAREYLDEKSMSVILKRGYAPFEQYYSEGKQGAWTDIYALCAVMYHCLTGEKPPEAPKRMEGEMLLLPSLIGVKIDPTFEKALMHGLQLRNVDRPQSIDELLSEMEIDTAEIETILPTSEVSHRTNKSKSSSSNDNFKTKISPNSSISVDIEDESTINSSSVKDISDKVDYDPNKHRLSEVISAEEQEEIRRKSEESKRRREINRQRAEQNNKQEEKIQRLQQEKKKEGEKEQQKKEKVIEEKSERERREIICRTARVVERKKREEEKKQKNEKQNEEKSERERRKVIRRAAGVIERKRQEEKGNNEGENKKKRKKCIIIVSLIAQISAIMIAIIIALNEFIPKRDENGIQKKSTAATTTVPITTTATLTTTTTAEPAEEVNLVPIVDSGSCGENLTWTLDEEGTLIISGTGKMNDYDYEAAPWNNVKNVVVENGVTSIGIEAFEDCEKLASITLPDSVWSIGNHAFSYCLSLTSINIPVGVRVISRYAFFSCESLASINLPDGLTTIGDSAFSGCESLKSIIIPDSVTTICYDAFNNCDSLKSIAIPKNVESIDGNIFEWCKNLTEITVSSENQYYCKVSPLSRHEMKNLS